MKNRNELNTPVQTPDVGELAVRQFLDGGGDVEVAALVGDATTQYADALDELKER